MNGDIDEWINQIHQGDAAETLAEMPADSVDCVMTSPPYFGLRDYGVDGQIGLEESLKEYVDRLVSVADELRRVLKPEGSFWLNLGDSYRDKNLQLTPHKVAIALQNDEWLVRNRVTWSKPDPLPTSANDRLMNKTESVYHFVQQRQYYYDLDSIREDYSTSSLERGVYAGYDVESKSSACRSGDLIPGESRETVRDFTNAVPNEKGKNPGDVWEITADSFPDAHFAVYPMKLCERPIKATCPEDGIVLDPFAGAGTTCLVAKELGRDFIGIDLNPEYVAMSQGRVGVDVDQPELLDDEHTPLSAFADGGQQ